MHSGFIHRVSIIRLAALALLALCLVQPQVRAQELERKTAAAAQPELDEVSFVFHTISWGMVRGQTARFTVVNPNEPSERERRRMVFIQVMLFDAGGAVIAKSDEIAIPPGEFRSVDFNRDDLPVVGEPGGRVQTRAQVRYKSFSIVDRTQLSFPPSIELFDNNTGRTTAVWITTGFFEVLPPRKPQ